MRLIDAALKWIWRNKMTDKNRLIQLIKESGYNGIKKQNDIINLADYLIEHGVTISAEFKPLKDSCVYYNEKGRNCTILTKLFCAKDKQCSFYKGK